MTVRREQVEKAGCWSPAIKPGGWGGGSRGGKNSDRKGGVREGCRGGVKTHLFLDGCEFRLERRVAWEHSIA